MRSTEESWDELRDEAETDLRRGEVPFLENKSEAVKTGEDEGIAEATEEREESDNRLGQEEEVRPPHERQDAPPAEALEEGTSDLVRTVDVRIPARLASTLSFLVEQDRSTCLGNGEEVDGLDDSAEHQLSVEHPVPASVFRDEAANNGSNHGAGAGREDDVEHGKLLGLRTEHVGDHAKGDTATSRR